MPLLPWSHGAASCRKEIDIFIYSSIYIILYIYLIYHMNHMYCVKIGNGKMFFLAMSIW